MLDKTKFWAMLNQIRTLILLWQSQLWLRKASLLKLPLQSEGIIHLQLLQRGTDPCLLICNSLHAKCNGIGESFWASICNLLIENIYSVKWALWLRSVFGAILNDSKMFFFNSLFILKKFLYILNEFLQLLKETAFSISLLDKQVVWSQAFFLWCYRA